MKIILFIAAAFLLTSLNCRSEYKDPVLDFVYSSYGKKVGNGVCLSFVEEAMNKKYNDWFSDYYSNDDSMEVKSVTEPMVGDVVLFVYREKEMAHIGIILDVRGDTMTFASQNNGDSSEESYSVINHGDTVSVYKSSKVECYDVLMSERRDELFCFRF